LIIAMAEAGVLPPEEAEALCRVHATFVAEGLACTLDRRPRLVVENAALATARALVVRTAEAHGLVFAP
jgi:glutamate-ammonia-ligase adenylyltransferase